MGLYKFCHGCYLSGTVLLCACFAPSPCSMLLPYDRHLVVNLGCEYREMLIFLFSFSFSFSPLHSRLKIVRRALGEWGFGGEGWAPCRGAGAPITP